MCIYLFIQALSDIRDRQVYTLFNDITVMITAIYVFLTGTVVSADIFLCSSLMIIILYRMHIYGSGDAKSLLAILFSFRGDVIPLLITVFIANIVFLLTNRGKKVGAYFPALFVGYLTVTLYGVL